MKKMTEMGFKLETVMRDGSDEPVFVFSLHDLEWRKNALEKFQGEFHVLHHFQNEVEEFSKQLKNNELEWNEQKEKGKSYHDQMKLFTLNFDIELARHGLQAVPFQSIRPSLHSLAYEDKELFPSINSLDSLNEHFVHFVEEIKKIIQNFDDLLTEYVKDIEEAQQIHQINEQKK